MCVDWQVGAGEGDGVRALIAFYPTEAANSNGRVRAHCRTFSDNNSLRIIDFEFLTRAVTLLITGLGADFTRLESFGKVDAFAETLVGSKIFHQMHLKRL